MNDTPDDIRETAQVVFDHLNTNNYDADCSAYEKYQDVEAIAKAILAERQRNQWQPIETAPKEGRILVYIPDIGIEMVEWDDGEKAWRTSSWCWCDPATHWTTLPFPPIQPKP